MWESTYETNDLEYQNHHHHQQHHLNHHNGRGSFDYAASFTDTVDHHQNAAFNSAGTSAVAPSSTASSTSSSSSSAVSSNAEPDKEEKMNEEHYFNLYEHVDSHALLKDINTQFAQFQSNTSESTHQMFCQTADSSTVNQSQNNFYAADFVVNVNVVDHQQNSSYPKSNANNKETEFQDQQQQQQQQQQSFHYNSQQHSQRYYQQNYKNDCQENGNFASQLLMPNGANSMMFLNYADQSTSFQAQDKVN